MLVHRTLVSDLKCAGPLFSPSPPGFPIPTVLRSSSPSPLSTMRLILSSFFVEFPKEKRTLSRCVHAINSSAFPCSDPIPSLLQPFIFASFSLVFPRENEKNRALRAPSSFFRLSGPPLFLTCRYFAYPSDFRTRKTLSAPSKAFVLPSPLFSA